MSISIDEMINKRLEKADDKNPIIVAFEKNLRYYNDFVEVLNTFEKNLSKKQIENLLDDKIQLESKYNEVHYLQAVSEINVLYYILRKYNNNFIYEPKYNGDKNPECSFEYNGKLINIEVKCPDLTKRMECEERDTLKLFAAERLPKYNEILDELKDKIKLNLNRSNFSNVEEKKRLDNKLKDYIISASEKFPISDETNFNILAISLDIIADLDEWYEYIFGKDGVFTTNSFVPLEKYENVDAILLTTSMSGHIRYSTFENVSVWNLEETINLLLLNPLKENSDTGSFYFSDAINIFGDLTKRFLAFLNELDEKSENDLKVNNEHLIQNIIKQKIIGLDVISKFIEKLQANQ